MSILQIVSFNKNASAALKTFSKLLNQRAVKPLQFNNNVLLMSTNSTTIFKNKFVLNTNTLNSFKKSTSIRFYSDEKQESINEIKSVSDIKEKLKQKYIDEEKKYNGKLIYVGQLTHQLKAAKILSLSSSLLGLMMLPLLTDTLSTSTMFAKLFVFGTTSFFIFATPILSQILTRKYVSRMYYNHDDKKFTAILFNFFLFEYKLEFTIDDVSMPDIPGIFTTLKVKSNDRSLFVDLNQITDLSITEKILGYDKEFDVDKYNKEKK